MRAVVYEEFGKALEVKNIPAPEPRENGVVLRVTATGLCRSDWHGWMGHDSDIHPPHVPGHELAGVVHEVGKGVTHWTGGERVTVPFVCACGTCPQCRSGNHQVCDHQSQPGFTHWGSFAEYVALDYADTNLVALPDEIDDVTAASLGCRFITSFRAIVDQAQVRGGEWVAVHGCGGVGLSAIMIASALGANVIAVDITPEKLELARALGACAAVNGKQDDPVKSIVELTKGGAHVGVDALGSTQTCFNSIASLRKRGRHVQVGLMAAEQRFPPVPMDRVIAYELQLMGSHGMQAHRYPEMLAMILAKKVQPEKLIGRRLSLEEGAVELANMDNFPGTGVMVIDRFGE